MSSEPEVIAAYYRDFSTLDVQLILPYFHEPSLLIRADGVLATATRADAAAFFTPVMEGLRARGYGRSEYSVQKVTPLSATSTLVTGIAIRFKVDGQELGRVGITYVMQKIAAEWKIAVVINHEVQ